MEGGNLATSEVDKCKLRVWNKHFELITESFQNPDKYNKPYQYNAFTDSSAKSGKVGCGIVWYKNMQVIADSRKRLPDCCTVFQAEIKGIVQ